MSKSIQSNGDHISGQSNVPISRPAHALSAERVTEELQSNAVTGLSPEEAIERLAKYDSNELEKEKGVQPLQIFIAQIFNAMTLVRKINPRLLLLPCLCVYRFSSLHLLLVLPFRRGLRAGCWPPSS